MTLADNIIRINQNTNSYEAALIADYLRNLLISKEETFSFETVMSHPSKLETLRQSHAAGFKNYLYFISTESAEINIHRVEERIAKGGHRVDPQKIRERYVRSMELLRHMLPYCRRCFIFDNSMESGYRLIAQIEDGENITIMTDDTIPFWVYKYLFSQF